MVAQAQFSATEVTARTGESEILGLTLYNLGAQTDTYTIVPSGLGAGWILISPPTVTLFPGSNEIVRVTIRPPRMSSTPAGPYPLTVRVIPQNDPNDVVIAEATVDIEAFHDRRIHVMQPVRRARRRAQFEFLVENHGNSHASCRLQLIDLTKRLDGRFDPPAVGVEPGGNALVRLRVKALGRQWRRGSRTIPFTIEASQQNYPSAENVATLVQSPVMPEGLGRKFFGLAALSGAIAAGWVFLLKPAAERAAKDAVQPGSGSVITAPDQSATGTTIVQATNPTQSTIVGPPATAGPVVDPTGQPIYQSFEVAAVAGAAASTSVFTVPAGQTLQITDVILQNPSFDTGAANLRRNADPPLFRWDLENSTGTEPTTLRSGLTFAPGDTLTFEVTCSASGNAAAGTCTTSLLLTGKLIPVA